MSARGAVVAALLVLAGLLPGTASAAPEAGLLVVQGRGGTTTTLVVEQTLLLAVSASPSLLGGGDYAGVLLTPAQPTAGSGPTGAVQVRAFGDSTRDLVLRLGTDRVLEAGRYDVVLLGQGPVRASFPLQDAQAPGVRVAPRTPLAVRFLGRADALPLNAPRSRIEMPGALPAGKRAIQLALRDRTSVEDFRMCATTGPRCNPRPLPAALPVDAVPAPAPGTAGPAADVLLHDRAMSARGLLWSVDGALQQADDTLRAAAIVF